MAIRLRRIHAEFNFADADYSPKRSFIERPPTPNEDFILFDVAITDALIPLFVGLDTILGHCLDILYSRKVLSAGRKGWEINIQMKFGHCFVRPLHNIYTSLFIQAGLEHMHLHFYHSSTTKLYHLIQITCSGQADKSVRDAPQKTADKRNICYDYHSRPFRFMSTFVKAVLSSIMNRR